MRVKSTERYLSLLQELERYQNRNNPDGFCLIYGSQADGTGLDASDLDLMFFSPKRANPAKHVSFILQLHRKYGMTIDNEVPHENKLLVSYADVEAAISLKPFLSITGLAIPEIKKTNTFLSSHDIILRLILNTLTGPHMMIAGNASKYQNYKHQAECSVTYLALSLAQDRFGGSKIFTSLLLEVLTSGEAGQTGESYLGDKDKRTVTNQLWTVLNCGIEFWLSIGVVQLNAPGQFKLNMQLDYSSFQDALKSSQLFPLASVM